MSRKTNGTNGQNEKTLTKPAKADEVPFQPVYFLSLEVENFRCFGPKQTLNLATQDGRPARWTVILGENGVGKTTLLRLIADFQPVVEKHPQHDNLLSRFTRPKIVSFLSEHGSRSKVYETRRAVDNYVYFSVDYGLGSLSNNNDTSVPRTNMFATFQELFVASQYFGNIELGNMVCFGYGASRRMGKANLSAKRDIDNCTSLFSDDAELLNAEEWLLQADYAASRESPYQERAIQQRDRVKDILVRLLPDVEDIRIAPINGENGGSLPTPTVQVKTPYGWVGIQSLSLGYRALITWMVDLASRLFDHYPHSADPLAEPAVVLVDEIDLHLHPRWQRTLMRFLSDIFKNTQFIVTAHSPLVVQAADADANIVLLRRDGDHVVIENDMKTIRGWRVDQILTSELFGLETARPPQWDKPLAERNALLAKGKLTKADEARLAELEKQVGDLPTGETPSDMEAMDIIRRAAELLKSK